MLQIFYRSGIEAQINQAAHQRSNCRRVLLPAIERLHALHPEVRILLDTSTRMLNLAKREADIPVRSFRPENPDLVARRLARWPMALFASKAYLERHGKPTPGSAFAGHDLVIYQGNWSENRSPTLAGEPLHEGRIVSTFNSGLMLRTAIRAGIGIGELPIHLAEHDDLVQIGPGPHAGQSTKSGPSRIKTFDIPRASPR